MEKEALTMVLILAVVLSLCGISGWLMFKDGREYEKADKRTIRAELIYGSIMVALTLCISVTYVMHHANMDVFTMLKRLILLCVIWPLAYIDYKTYRIPNTFIIYGLSCRAVLVPFELMLNPYFRVAVMSELIAATALFLAALLCTICLRGSIGAGDMKLFVVMGLFLGLEMIWSAVFTALLISFLIAVYLLIMKKKTKKDSIPFGPAIVSSVYLSIFLIGG